MVSEEEQVPEEIEPVEQSDDPLEPVPEFGEQDEAAQKDEWEEDASEGGS